jgi:hypothetical protein
MRRIRQNYPYVLIVTVIQQVEVAEVALLLLLELGYIPDVDQKVAQKPLS